MGREITSDVGRTIQQSKGSGLWQNFTLALAEISPEAEKFAKPGPLIWIVRPTSEVISGPTCRSRSCPLRIEPVCVIHNLPSAFKRPREKKRLSRAIGRLLGLWLRRNSTARRLNTCNPPDHRRRPSPGLNVGPLRGSSS